MIPLVECFGLHILALRQLLNFISNIGVIFLVEKINNKKRKINMLHFLKAYFELDECDWTL
jgi:type III secretory pathway component EscU